MVMTLVLIVLERECVVVMVLMIVIAGEELDLFHESEHDVASLLKLYLREITTPLVSTHLRKNFVNSLSKLHIPLPPSLALSPFHGYQP